MELPTGDCSATNKLFKGYQVQVGEGESALSWQLTSGLTWRKKVWPRVAYPRSLHRWNTVEEILSYLMSFDSHKRWISTEVPVKPPSGTILFFNRTKTKNYRSDGYDWKTRKSNASVREDRMKLKVFGMQLLYGCYTHCASIPSLHRRSYWLIQDPDIIMVHYLEVEGDIVPADTLTASVDSTVQDEAEVRRSLTPSNWAYLTVSDRNICSIISQSNTALEIRTLTTQLRLTLDQNVTKAANLDQAVAMNNSGLPFDWVKEAQPKRHRARVAPKESGALMSSHDSGGNPRLINIGGVSAHNAVVSEPANENQILKALSSSPHIILCCPQNGSVSYVLLNSASLPGGLGKTGGEGGEGVQFPTGPPSFENHECKPSASETCVQSLAVRCKGASGPKGKTKAEEQEDHKSDYDLSKFNSFASRLTEVDPLLGFCSLDSGVSLEDFVAPRIPGGLKFDPSTRASSTLESMSGVEMEPMDSLPSPAHATLPENRARIARVLQSTSSQVVPTTSRFSSASGSGAGDVERRGGDMLDLTLAIDPECLRDLMKVPLSPTEEMEGGEVTGEGGREVTVDGSVTLSPISQLMQSLQPPLAAEEEERNVFLGVSLPEGVNPTSEAVTRLTGNNATHTVHSAHLGPLDNTLYSSPHNSSHTPALPLFPEHPSPLNTPYQWEDLLNPPSDTLTLSEQPHSHTSSPHSAIPQSHTLTSDSVPHSVHNPAPDTLFSQQSSCPDGPTHLVESQTATSTSLLTSQSEMAHLEPFYATLGGHSPPISLPNPLDEAEILSRGSIFRPLPSGGPTFLSPSASHSPVLGPSSPITSSVPDCSPGIPGAVEPNFLPGQSPLPRSVSPRSLSNIPEDVPMEMLLDPLNHRLVQGAGNFMDPSTGLSIVSSALSYRMPKSPTPSSPSIGSVSGHSTVSSLFDPGGESPSVLELCELLSESPNVQQHDFSNMTFTDMEQKQLYKAIQIIQNTFRKFKTQWQDLPRVEDRQKYAALLIENCYTRYRQLKQQQDRAARRIQHNYRMYRNRSRELNRAALFIQQMYRFHRIKRQQPDIVTTSTATPYLHHHVTTSMTSRLN